MSLLAIGIFESNGELEKLIGYEKSVNNEIKSTIGTLTKTFFPQEIEKDNRFYYLKTDGLRIYIFASDKKIAADGEVIRIFKNIQEAALTKRYAEIRKILENPAHTVSKLEKIKEEMKNVEEIMLQNIETVLNRGEHIETLVDKTDSLAQESRSFKKKSFRLSGNESFKEKLRRWCCFPFMMEEYKSVKTLEEVALLEQDYLQLK